MGATTGGSGPTARNLDGPPTFYISFWWGSGGSNILCQTGYTFLNFFWRRAVIPQTKKLDPPTLKRWLRLWLCVITYIVNVTVTMAALVSTVKVL